MQDKGINNLLIDHWIERVVLTRDRIGGIVLLRDLYLHKIECSHHRLGIKDLHKATHLRKIECSHHRLGINRSEQLDLHKATHLNLNQTPCHNYKNYKRIYLVLVVRTLIERVVGYARIDIYSFPASTVHQLYLYPTSNTLSTTSHIIHIFPQLHTNNQANPHQILL